MKLKLDKEYKNVYIFVSDALRYDKSPTITEHDSLIKTLSGGVSSPPGFGSLISGRYVTQHGAWNFNTKMRTDILSVFDLLPNSKFNFGYSLGDKVLGFGEKLIDRELNPMAEIEEPFIVMERGINTHSPYGSKVPNIALMDVDGGKEFLPDNIQFESTEEYWNSRKTDYEQINIDYDRAVDFAVKRFKSQLEDLEERGIREDTLIIFTADHGETLGEHGTVGHGIPTVPETVYVPTILCNKGISVEGDFMSHVDYLPTLASILNQNIKINNKLPGYDLTKGSPEHRYAYVGGANKLITEHSVWDKQGGHIFNSDSLLNWLTWFGYRLTLGADSSHNIRRPGELLKLALKRGMQEHFVLGEPEVSEKKASNLLDSVRSGEIEPEQTELNQEVEERLKTLGYR